MRTSTNFVFAAHMFFTWLPGGARVCTSDADPHAFVVAVDRDRLPDRPFTIDLFEDPCERVAGVCDEQRTRVDE